MLQSHGAGSLSYLVVDSGSQLECLQRPALICSLDLARPSSVSPAAGVLRSQVRSSGMSYRSPSVPLRRGPRSQNQKEGMWTPPPPRKDYPSFLVRSSREVRWGRHLWKVQCFSFAAVCVTILSLVTTANGPSCDRSSHYTRGLSTIAGVGDIEPLFLTSEVRTKEVRSRILLQHGESAV